MRGKMIGLSVALGFGVCTPVAGQCLDWAPGYGVPGFGTDNTVSAAAVLDDGSGPALYVGGSFTTIGGIAAKGIAKWDGSAWQAVGPDIGPGSITVSCLAAYNDGSGPAIYAGGQFAASNGAAGNRIVKLVGGSWVPLGSGLNNGVNSMAAFGGALYVGGSFSTAGGVATSNFAKWDGSSWTTYSSGPTTLSDSALAYDAARGRVVLFGGSFPGGSDPYNTITWEWSGVSWVQAATTGPGGVVDARMIYDTARGRIIKVGGLYRGAADQGADLATWSWNGTTWTQIATPFAGGKRYGFSMAYDQARDRIVIFGGGSSTNSSLEFSDTWEFDGVTWTQRTFGVSPPKRRAAAMTYDVAHQCIVMFGGTNVAGDLRDTWLYDGTTWVQASNTGPSARPNAEMTYDTARARSVLRGGVNLTDTWAWNGVAWTMLTPINNNEFTCRGQIAYDIAHDRIIQRSSLSATWGFNGTSWSAIPVGGPNNSVNAMVVHDDGTGPALYIGGSFTTVAGVPLTNGIARWTGSIWSSINGVGGTVNALLSTSGAGSLDGLYVGGSTGVNRWRSTGWLALPDVSGTVQALALIDPGIGPRVIAAGQIHSQGATVSDFITAWNGSAWTSMGSGLAATSQTNPYCLATYSQGGSPRLLVGGNFKQAGGKSSVNLASWPVACYAPIITTQPTDQVAVAYTSVFFDIAAHGTETVNYTWRRNGVPLVDSQNHITGSHATQLRLGPNWSYNDAGTYDCVVSNTLGSVTSNPVSMTLAGVPSDGPVSAEVLLATPRAIDNQPGSSMTQVYNAGGHYPGPIVVSGGVTGNRFALATIESSLLNVQVVTGQTYAPLGAGVLVQSITGVADTEGANALEYATLSGTGINGTNQHVMLALTPSGQVPLWRGSDPAPGFPSGTIFFQDSTMNAGINSDGVVAFAATVTGATSGQGAWRWSPTAGTTLVAKTGDLLSGTSSHMTTFDIARKSVSETGNIAFVATLDSLTGYHHVVTSDTALVSGTGGSLGSVARAGDPAPGFPSGYNLDYIFDYAQSPNDGIAFVCTVAGPGGAVGNGLYRNADSGITKVAVSGDPAVGAPATGVFSAMAAFGISPTGSVPFRSSVSYSPKPPGAPTAGVWVGDPESQSCTKVWLANDPFPPGISPTFFAFNVLDTFSMSSSSALLMRGEVTTSAGIHNALLGWTPQHGLFSILGPGSQVEVSPGIFKTVADATIEGESPSQSQQKRSFQLRDDGTFVFTVGFTDLSTAVCVGHLAEYLSKTFPCPVFLTTPRSVVLDAGQTKQVAVTVTGRSPMTFQWYQDDLLLADGLRPDGSTIIGSATDHLSIESANGDDVGIYTCHVSNTCGEATSPAIPVRCRADIDGNPGIDLNDFFLFLNCFDQTLPCADIDDIAGVDLNDFFTFLTAFDQSC